MGEDIPLAARIVAVADVYDALTSRRTYKNAFAHDVAKAMIVEESGTHFDSRIIDSFLRIESTVIETRERYSDDTFSYSIEESMTPA